MTKLHPEGAGSPGASASAIQAHYDLSDDFYRLWLDPSLTSPLPYTQAQYDAIKRRLENVFTLQARIAFIF